MITNSCYDFLSISNSCQVKRCSATKGKTLNAHAEYHDWSYIDYSRVDDSFNILDKYIEGEAVVADVGSLFGWRRHIPSV